MFKMKPGSFLSKIFGGKKRQTISRMPEVLGRTVQEVLADGRENKAKVFTTITPAEPAKPKRKKIGARRAVDYRAAQRNHQRSVGVLGAAHDITPEEQQKIARRQGLLSQEHRLKSLHEERQAKNTLRRMQATGSIPLPGTPEYAMFSMLKVRFTPRVGPGKKSILTMHRAIAIDEVRQHHRKKRSEQMVGA